MNIFRGGINYETEFQVGELVDISRWYQISVSLNLVQARKERGICRIGVVESIKEERVVNIRFPTGAVVGFHCFYLAKVSPLGQLAHVDLVKSSPEV